MPGAWFPLASEEVVPPLLEKWGSGDALRLSDADEPAQLVKDLEAQEFESRSQILRLMHIQLLNAYPSCISISSNF